MKATGIVRKIDHLGRLVIPIELRRTHSIPVGTPIEIFVDESGIVLKKYTPSVKPQDAEGLLDYQKKCFEQGDLEEAQWCFEQLMNLHRRDKP